MDDMSIILQKLASVETDLRLLREEVGELRKGENPSCALHYLEVTEAVKRIAKVEVKLESVQAVIGKKELIVAAFGALGVGIGFAFKALVTLWRG